MIKEFTFIGIGALKRLASLEKGQKPLKILCDYYPFGLKQKGYNNTINGGNDIAQNWKFGGKEYNQELGLNWYDISARNYDPALGRWMNIDPLAEQMRRHSPYNYAFDNPIYFVDPDGMRPISYTDPKVNSSRTKTVGVVNYKTSVTHSGRGGRYHKTNYSEGFLPGTTVSSHSHNIVNTEAYNSFSGVSITKSSTSKSPKLGGLATLNGIADPGKVSNSATVEVNVVSGQYYNAEGDKVDSISEASRLVVNTTNVNETVDLETGDLSSAEVEVNTTKTTTGYDIITGSNGLRELVNGKTTSDTNTESVNFSDSSSGFQQHAINKLETNNFVKGRLIEAAKNSIKGSLNDINN